MYTEVLSNGCTGFSSMDSSKVDSRWTSLIQGGDCWKWLAQTIDPTWKNWRTQHGYISKGVLPHSNEAF